MKRYKETIKGYAWALVLIAYFAVVGPMLLSSESTFGVLFGIGLGALVIHLAIRRFLPVIRTYLANLDN